jgi:hypothetical protein
MSRQRRSSVRWLVLIAVIALLGALPTTGNAQSTPRYFAETGHYLDGAFRSYWERSGGIAIFGLPITEEYVQNSDGRVVQYFERARFELNPADPANPVSLGLIGREYLEAQGLGFPRVGPIPNTANQRYFPETGHTLRGLFKSFWEQRGGLSIFGYPLSEEITEQLSDGRNYTVQYFERARFELAGGQVRLGLLGSTLAPCQRKPGLPPNNPPDGPVAEGDPAECASIPNAIASGRVYPEVSRAGTVLGFEASGYEPGEFVSMWLNLPDGSARGLPYQAIADSDGGVLIGFRTVAGDPSGNWSLVGQGMSSGRVVLAGFRIE